MLPDVKRYFDTIDQAQKVFDKAEAEADKEHPKRYERTDEGRTQHEAWRPLTKAAVDVFDAAVSAAWEALKTSGDRQVAWIAENAGDHRDDEAEEALKILPATVEQLDDLAVDNGWCGTWNDFRERMIEDGVFGDDAVSPARKALNDYMRGCGLYLNERKRMYELIDALTAEKAGA